MKKKTHLPNKTTELKLEEQIQCLILNAFYLFSPIDIIKTNDGSLSFDIRSTMYWHCSTANIVYYVGMVAR